VPSGPRIGQGGQILGSGSAASSAVSQEDQRAAREARLAALERRGATAPTEAPAAAAPAPAPAPAAPAAAPAQELYGKAKKDADKQDIMRRIAEERAERAERMAAQAPVAAAKPAAKPAAMPAASSAPAMPSADADRIKGQLGGGISKVARAKEREAIMQQMEEDRQRYEERHVASGAVEAQLQAAAVAQATSSSRATGLVRLQIRCATSGRAVVTTDFKAEDQLSSVRDFAVKELELLPGDDVHGPQLSLAFPPRTTFSAEQLSSSLGALGLAPSATLLIKGLPDDRPDPAEATPPEPAEEDPADTAMPGAGPAESPCCPKGHAMAAMVMEEEMWCDKTGQALPVGASAWYCKECDYMESPGCSQTAA